jgi:phage shock protein C
MEKKILTKGKNPMFLGVCDGLADYLGTDVTAIRIATVLLSFFSGFGLVAYIVGAILMPNAE